MNDYFFIKMTTILFNRKVGILALIMSYSSFWFNEIMIRPFSNSMETLLFNMMIYYFVNYFEENNNKDIWKLAIVVPISFFIRPTSSILFLPMCVYALFMKWEIIMSLIFTTSITTTIVTLLDYHFYDRLVIPFYNFV